MARVWTGVPRPAICAIQLHRWRPVSRRVAVRADIKPGRATSPQPAFQLADAKTPQASGEGSDAPDNTHVVTADIITQEHQRSAAMRREELFEHIPEMPSSLESHLQTIQVLTRTCSVAAIVLGTALLARQLWLQASSKRSAAPAAATTLSLAPAAPRASELPDPDAPGAAGAASTSNLTQLLGSRQQRADAGAGASPAVASADRPGLLRGWWRNLDRVYYINCGAQHGILPRLQLDPKSKRTALVAFEDGADAEWAKGVVREQLLAGLLPGTAADMRATLRTHVVGCAPLFLDDLAQMQGSVLEIVPRGVLRHDSNLSERELVVVLAEAVAGRAASTIPPATSDAAVTADMRGTATPQGAPWSSSAAAGPAPPGAAAPALGRPPFGPAPPPGVPAAQEISAAAVLPGGARLVVGPQPPSRGPDAAVAGAAGRASAGVTTAGAPAPAGGTEARRNSGSRFDPDPFADLTWKAVGNDAKGDGAAPSKKLPLPAPSASSIDKEEVLKQLFSGLKELPQSASMGMALGEDPLLEMLQKLQLLEQQQKQQQSRQVAPAPSPPPATLPTTLVDSAERTRASTTAVVTTTTTIEGAPSIGASSTADTSANMRAAAAATTLDAVAATPATTSAAATPTTATKATPDAASTQTAAVLARTVEASAAATADRTLATPGSSTAAAEAPAAITADRAQAAPLQPGSSTTAGPLAPPSGASASPPHQQQHGSAQPSAPADRSPGTYSRVDNPAGTAQRMVEEAVASPASSQSAPGGGRAAAVSSRDATAEQLEQVVPIVLEPRSRRGSSDPSTSTKRAWTFEVPITPDSPADADGEFLSRTSISSAEQRSTPSQRSPAGADDEFFSPSSSSSSAAQRSTPLLTPRQLELQALLAQGTEEGLEAAGELILRPDNTAEEVRGMRQMLLEEYGRLAGMEAGGSWQGATPPPRPSSSASTDPLNSNGGHRPAASAAAAGNGVRGPQPISYPAASQPLTTASNANDNGQYSRPMASSSNTANGRSADPQNSSHDRNGTSASTGPATGMASSYREPAGAAPPPQPPAASRQCPQSEASSSSSSPTPAQQPGDAAPRRRARPKWRSWNAERAAAAANGEVVEEGWDAPAAPPHAPAEQPREQVVTIQAAEPATNRTEDGAEIVSKRIGNPPRPRSRRTPQESLRTMNTAVQLLSDEAAAATIDVEAGGRPSAPAAASLATGTGREAGQQPWWKKQFKGLFVPYIQHSDGGTGFVSVDVSMTPGRTDVRVLTFEDRHDAMLCSAALKGMPDYEPFTLAVALMPTETIEEDVGQAQAYGRRSDGIVAFRKGKLELHVGMSPEAFVERVVYQAAAQLSLERVGFDFRG